MSKTSSERKPEFFRCTVSEYTTKYLSPRTSQATGRHYRFILITYFKYIVEDANINISQLCFRHLTMEATEKFLNKIRSNGASAKTCNNYLSIIRAFVKFALLKAPGLSCIGILDITRLKEEKSMTVRYIEEDAIKAIIKAARGDRDEDRRNHLFVKLLFLSGARVSELVGVRLKDFVFEKGRSTVMFRGKGGKDRLVPLPDSLAQEVSFYIKTFHLCSKPEDNLFFLQNKTDCKRRMMQPHKAEAIVKEAADKARLTCSSIPEYVSCHMFRHSRAMQLYRKGVPLSVVGQFLGHSNPETTLIYANADTEMKRKAIAKAVNDNFEEETFKDRLCDAHTDEAVLKLMGLLD